MSFNLGVQMDFSTTFHELRLANLERQREWDGDSPSSLEYRGNELAGEVGEACNVIKKLVRAQAGKVGSRATLDDLRAELADIVICVDLIAAQTGIDLADAVKAKFDATSTKYGLRTRFNR